MSERSTLSRRTEEECRPLLLSMFRVLKELLLYCEEHSRADLAEEVAEALSMCQADFTNLKERLNAGRVDRVGVDVQRSTLSLSPLACHTVGPVDSSPLPDPPDSPSSNSHMLSQLVETLDIEQLQARRHPSAPTPPPPPLHRPRPPAAPKAPLCTVHAHAPTPAAKAAACSRLCTTTTTITTTTTTTTTTGSGALLQHDRGGAADAPPRA